MGGGIWEFSVLVHQFFCEPKTALTDTPRFLDLMTGKQREDINILKCSPWEVVKSSCSGIYLAKTRVTPAQHQCAQTVLPPRLGCHRWAPLAAPPVSRWEDTGQSPDPHRPQRCSGAGPGQNRTGAGCQQDECCWELPRKLTLNASRSPWARLELCCPGRQHQPHVADEAWNVAYAKWDVLKV